MIPAATSINDDTVEHAGLVFSNIEKSFGGTHALRGVSMRVKRGEVVALLGENGAGKSTLIKILGGIYTPDRGQVHIDGQVYSHSPGRVNHAQPVAFIHQDLGLIQWMSIAENMALALGYPRKFGLVDWNAVGEAARSALRTVDCDIDPSTRISDLGHTEKALVAIARALAVKCDFLVLDEPTASLPADEVERLFKVMRTIRDQGVGMIYVSHRLDEIFRIAERVVVLRDGLVAGAREVATTEPDELVNLIVGRKTRDFSRPEVHPGKLALHLSNYMTGTVGPVDLELLRGEVVGLVGLRGAGHEEVGRSLFGEIPHMGRVLLDGAVPNLSNPRSAMASGIGLVARERTVESLATALTIRENVFINPLAIGRTLLSFRSRGEEERHAIALGREVALSPNDPTLPIEALSGGNQQKVIVGRWLSTNRKLLIAEDPTAGVDVGARAEIYSLLFDAVSKGMAVLVVSTDFEEIADICHRALVFSRGKVVAELSGDNLTTQFLINAASASE